MSDSSGRLISASLPLVVIFSYNQSCYLIALHSITPLIKISNDKV